MIYMNLKNINKALKILFIQGENQKFLKYNKLKMNIKLLYTLYQMKKNKEDPLLKQMKFNQN